MFLYAPLAETEYARVSETRLSGFESRVGYQISRGSEALSPALLQLGCGKETPPRVQRADRPRGGEVCMNSSRCSAARQRASFGTRRPQVRLLSARPNDSPVAQRNEERAVTTREAEGSIPSGGASHGAVIQKKECLLVERDVAGSSPAGAAILPARNSIARVADSYSAGCRLNSCRAGQLLLKLIW